MDMRRSEHVALILPDSGGDVMRGGRRSWFRLWNQCTRLQRSLTLMIVLALITVTMITIISADSWWNQQQHRHQQQQQQQRTVGLSSGPAVGHIQIAPLRFDGGRDVPNAAAIVADNSVDTVGARPAALSRLVVQPPQPRDDDGSQPIVGDGVGVPPPPPQPVISADANAVEDDIVAPHRPPAPELDGAMVPANQKSRTGPNEVHPVPAAAVPVSSVAAGAELLESPKDFKGPTNQRQKAVVNAFRHAWTGYKEFAWGHDNLKPISMVSHDWFGLGLTIVDSLDTMYIMDLQEDFDEARDWIEQHLHFDINRDINLFEVTIRVLGGLLSAYHLSGDRMFLDKAVDLGQRLMPCFDSPSGIPFSDVNLATLNAHSPKWSPDSSTSEVTTIQLEFRDLARSTGKPAFARAVERINGVVHGLEKVDGLVPIFINANTGTFRSFATVSLGARGDSYYEYLLKQWLQSGQRPQDESLIDDYRTAIAGVLTHLVRTTPTEHHVYIGELINGKDFKPKMDHLTCYLPGTLLLGQLHAGQPASHRRLADDLLETCYQTYMKQPTQLAAEITYFNLAGESLADMYVKSNDAHNLLRPEFIESLYYFYALTGNRTYQDMGWTVFEAFERHTRVRAGYTSIGNVKNALNTRPRDMMESFFLGETLKYFYLLFSDDRREVDLDRFVFNSEAHLVPIWGQAGAELDGA